MNSLGQLALQAKTDLTSPYTVVKFKVSVQLLEPSLNIHVGKVIVAKVMSQYRIFNTLLKSSNSSEASKLFSAEWAVAVTRAVAVCAITLPKTEDVAAASSARAVVVVSA